MHRLVYVSANLPGEDASQVHGLWQRQRLFIDALAPQYDEVHCVFWRSHAAAQSDVPTTIRALAAAAFGRPVSVSLLPTGLRSSRPSFLEFYISSLLHGPYGLGLQDLTAPRRIEALRQALPTISSLVFAQGLDGMAALTRLHGSTAPVVWDANDIETVKFLRQLRVASWTPGKPLRYLQTGALYAEERRAAQAAAISCVCSEPDRQRAQDWFGGRFETVPNAVALPESPHLPPSNPPTLLFVGFMGYEPNRDAADWLMAEVWPRIASEMPRARLLVAGGRPEELRMFMNPPRGVSILGFVPDLAAVYGQAHVFVCPVLAGSGTRVKLLEAGGYAKAIVSTTVGAEGLDFQDGVSAIFADGAVAFAQSCLALLRDPTRQRSIGHAARELVRERYERDAVISRIRNLVASAKGVGNA